MDYKNQLVLNGQISDIGEALTVNVDKSYRAGIEIEAGVKICRSLRWDVNATLSRNRIKDYEFSYTLYNNDDDWAYVFTNEQGQQVESWEKEDAKKAEHTDKFSSTPIAFSPSFIGNNTFTYTYGDFTASLVSQYVSRQYLDNSGSKVRSLDSYFVSNLVLGYTLRPRFVKEMGLRLMVNNLFNETYESNGYTNGVFRDCSGNRYFAQAGTTVLGTVTLNF